MYMGHRSGVHSTQLRAQQAQAELADMGRRMQEAEDMAGKCQKQAKKAVLKALDSEAAGRREGELRAAAVR